MDNNELSTNLASLGTDCISRHAAIEALRDYLAGKRCPDDGTLTCRLIENEVINKLPSVQPEQRWIPVSERLPEDYGEFLVTYKSDGEQIFMDIIEYETSFEYDYEKNRFKGVWIFADDWQAVNSEVIAWMPLPELYQGGEQE